MTGFPKRVCKFAFVSVVCEMIYCVRAKAQDGRFSGGSRTNFDDDSALNFVAARGELNAFIRRPTRQG
jgi:hypothetical protein